MMVRGVFPKQVLLVLISAGGVLSRDMFHAQTTGLASVRHTFQIHISATFDLENCWALLGSARQDVWLLWLLCRSRGSSDLAQKHAHAKRLLPIVLL